ncbi:HSF-type DNA-binding-domain-containing protein [Halteromyces radiatus]|uniref:HSF-type DNA-binding-domain-containing protein n=1 Tax=Halteromyces radiatus TaxID=101107 RepID=UPI0022209629|nr:HSF-type DNA-binding-domain-containing protein [Halteromyces radiatus]KAI8077804.1 HSF-type DNA-binding-domain-containing protein [Halteromyces radiatus]
MNFHDYAAASSQATTTTTTTSTNNNTYYTHPPKMTLPFSTSSLATTKSSSGSSGETVAAGYLTTHHNTPSVITYSTNALQTTTIVDTSPYSYSTSANQEYHPSYQPSDDNCTLSMNQLQMTSWLNQPTLSSSMVSSNYSSLDNDENLLIPLPERGVAGFVCKLYQSLEAPDNGEKYAHWCEHNGKDMFIIDCIPKFTETVLPKLFKHCKFASFVRQLNIYGFQRDTDARKSKDSRDKDTCRWYHTHFRPGRRDLFHLIRRKATRYSRRKRIKSEQEQEEQPVDDDSDHDDADTPTSHHQSPSIPSNATTPTMTTHGNALVYTSSPPSSSTLFGDHLMDSSSSSLMVSPTSQSALPSSSQQQQHSLSHQPVALPFDQLQQQHHAIPHPLQQQKQPSSDALCLSSPLDISTQTNGNYTTFMNDYQPPPPPQTMMFDHPSSMYNIMLQEPSVSPSSSSSSYQDELKAYITRLQHDYQQMHTYFTNELSKAHKQIEIQRLRSDSLERSLRGE